MSFTAIEYKFFYISQLCIHDIKLCEYVYRNLIRYMLSHTLICVISHMSPDTYMYACLCGIKILCIVFIRKIISLVNGD